MALYFGRATRVFFRTLPFVALRIVVGASFGLATVVYFGIIGWLALMLFDARTVSGLIGGIGLLVATLLFLVAMRFARRYVLYMVAAGHIAVIAHVVETDETPPNQIAFGTNTVRDGFTEANALFAVDQLIKAYDKAVQRDGRPTVALGTVRPGARTRPDGAPEGARARGHLPRRGDPRVRLRE